MRIIDKNKDYYDFYQNIYRDGTYTLDRRDSYNISKKEFAKHFWYETYWHTKDQKPIYLLLQVCHNFWLIQFIVTKKDEFNNCLDYELQLVDSWQDYTAERKMISLVSVKVNLLAMHKNNYKNAVSIIRMGGYDITHDFNKARVWKDTKYEERHIPILQDIGIPSIIDGFEIYKALEEYLSMEKTSTERTEAKGTTNDSKITSHGFDTKTSFRGKN